MTRTALRFGLLLPLTLTLGALGCETDVAVELAIQAPPMATQLEIFVLSGTCPNDWSSGQFRCGGAVLFQETRTPGSVGSALPRIEGRHAVVVVATSEGSCSRWFACESLASPAPLRIVAFTTDSCDAPSLCTGPAVCTFPVCDLASVVDVTSAGDEDGDGISNGIECCGPPCEEEPVFLSNLCGDADRDGVPDYLDSDSDDDGYSDAIECPLSEDGVLACNHNDSPLLDFREMNDADDYDMDGLTNSLECGAGGLTDDCADTDRDGYRDFRDRDSDGDGLTDGLECPQPDNPEGCRDSDEDGIPDWRQGGDPARCECPSLSVETLCRADAFGPYCTQEVRDLPETLTWLGPEGDFGAEASSIAPFDTFSVPGGAWRCEAEEPCDESTGDRIAVLRIEEDGTVVGYVIDSRSIDPGALLPAELVVRDLDIQLGRFLYGLAGGPQPSL